jgi:hypothetical protein
MNTLGNDGQETTVSSIAFNKFIEPAAIITIVVAATYYVGRTYIGSYYGRLGLDPTSLEFPTEFYIEQSTIPVLIGIGASYFSFSLAGRQHHRNNRKSALFGNILLLLAGILILIVGFQDVGQSQIFYVALGTIVLTATILLTYLGISFSVSIKSNFLFRLCALVAAFSIFVLTGQALGSTQGKKLINGDYREAVSVHFNWKEVAATKELDTDLILLLQNKSNYYVVKKQDLQSNNTLVDFFPKIYMIPEENIKFAVIRKVKNN